MTWINAVAALSGVSHKWYGDDYVKVESADYDVAAKAAAVLTDCDHRIDFLCERYWDGMETIEGVKAEYAEWLAKEDAEYWGPRMAVLDSK